MGGIAVTIVGLLLMLAVLTYMLETNQLARTFPLVLPELWQAAYGQEEEEKEEVSITLDSYFIRNNANL